MQTNRPRAEWTVDDTLTNPGADEIVVLGRGWVRKDHYTAITDKCQAEFLKMRGELTATINAQQIRELGMKRELTDLYQQAKEYDDSRCPSCRYPREKHGAGLGLPEEIANQYIPCEYCFLKAENARLKAPISVNDAVKIMQDEIARASAGKGAGMSEWVRVQERMPPDRRTVLVWCPERQNTYAAHWEAPVWWIAGGYWFRVEEDVHFWMPIPDPPPAKAPALSLPFTSNDID